MQNRSIFLSLLLLASYLFGNELPKANYFYDSNQVRYELYQTNGGQAYNWVFLPGGPGADSSYLRSLVDVLKLPGNVWLVDLPGNGNNVSSGPVDFDQWIALFPKVVRKFENLILVGHSFGGMFPLLFPELEECLKGFVILNSAPTLWHEEALAYSKQFNLPDFSEAMQVFVTTPSQETFAAALDACMPYYFPAATLAKGRKLLVQVPFQYLAAVWWQKKAVELNALAKWVPMQVPTLIVGGKYDCMCPFSLFEKDPRFKRDNIKLFLIEDAGHIGWIDNPHALNRAFATFISKLK